MTAKREHNYQWKYNMVNLFNNCGDLCFIKRR